MAYEPGCGAIPVQPIWIRLAPGTLAVPIVGAAAGRAGHVVGGQAPSPVPAGHATEVTRVDQTLATV